MNLTRFGIAPDFKIRGSVISYRLDGRRLLFLFGERHGIKPGVYANLLNAADLCNRNSLSCVGVEGWVDPSEPFPGEEVKQMYEEEKTQHGNNTGAIIESVLKRYRRRNFLFWKLLKLLQSSLPTESVEDSGLFKRVADLEVQYFGIRKDAIAYNLRQSAIFEPDHPHRDTWLEAKALAQVDQEFAEHELNVQRDDTFIEKMLSLWEQTGTEKPAILNAGTSHQYRIARRLRKDEKFRDVSYIHVEQP